MGKEYNRTFFRPFTLIFLSSPLFFTWIDIVLRKTAMLPFVGASGASGRDSRNVRQQQKSLWCAGHWRV